MQNKSAYDEVESAQCIDSPRNFRERFKASDIALEFIAKKREEIIDILFGKDERLLLIIGPCSIHDVNSAEDYACRLKKLSDLVSASFLIIMRTHFEKPRTALGWKGLIYDPYLNGSHDILAGLTQARQLLLKLATMNVATATEFLDPVTSHFIGDLISWGCVGARTVESQIHRQLASGLDMPVAFKNSTSGNIEAAIQGAIFAKSAHTFFGIDDEGHLNVTHTKGNKHAHIVLRGGKLKPNYDLASIAGAINQLKSAKLPQSLIIDCAHDNSSRIPEEQKSVFNSVLQQFIEGNRAIRGMMIESHLYGGNQHFPLNLNSLKYAMSLTDPCLDWDSTYELILNGHALLQNA